MDRLTPEQRHKNMSSIKSKDTSIELVLRKALWNKGIRYRKNYKELPGTPDIVLTKYKIAIFIVMICAACSTVFNVAGPKILGKATTALSEGLMEKIRGTGSIDFARIGTILLFVLGLYLMSALFSFIQGWIMTGVTQKVCYQLRKEISEKINTYETSIQPFEDCCTIFVAKHPVTKPNLERIEKSELNLTDVIDDLMKTAIETAEVIRIRQNEA